MVETSKRLLPIIIVEDDPEDRMLTEDALLESSPGFPVKFLENGEELLEYLEQQGDFSDCQQNPTPGIIVLDLNMPRLDGREALSRIKSHPSYRSIPVVVLTTSDSLQDIENCYQLGANSYITKPNNYRDLVQIMNAIKDYWFGVNTLPKGFSHES